MKPHLLLYNFYSSDEKQYIENNLTRALAISLKYEHILLNNFLREILTTQQYNDIFFTIEETFPIEIDIQKKVADIETPGQLIAVALSPIDLRKNIKNSPAPLQADNPITDLYIRVKDLCIIVEVKIYGEDSIPQLLGQVKAIADNHGIEQQNIDVNSITWSRLIELFLSSQQYLGSTQSSSVFINDFIRHIEQRFPTWFPVKTLNYLPYTSDKDTLTFSQIESRLNIIKSQVMADKEEPLRIFKDRISISLDYSWASEVNVSLEEHPTTKESSLKINMWPGDTKAQGCYLFSKDLKWTDHNSLNVGNNDYQILIYPYLKLSHWTRGVSWLPFVKDWEKYIAKMVTKDKFDELSGRWTKDQWPDFENEMDGVFPFKWREVVKWQESFLNSNRSYFDLAFGFEISVYIPYSRAQELDKNINTDETQPPPVSTLIRQVIEEIRLMVEGK